MPKEPAINTLLQEQKESKTGKHNFLTTPGKENRPLNPIRKKQALRRTVSFYIKKEHFNEAPTPPSTPMESYDSYSAELPYIEQLTEYSIHTSPFRIGRATINFPLEDLPSTNLSQASCELTERVSELTIND
jgi:hypothetical protein